MVKKLNFQYCYCDQITRNRANLEVGITLVTSTKSLWDFLNGFWIIAENLLFGQHTFLILAYFMKKCKNPSSAC